jgi:malonyl-CoA/methylmalonyl-CoA synthetase
MLSLIHRAGKWPEATAVISDDKTYTYQDLLDFSAHIAHILLDGQSDLEETRVAFMIDPGFDYVTCQWGIWRAGGIAVPLCVLHPLPSLRYVLENTRADILIVSPTYRSLLQPLAEELGIRYLENTAFDHSSVQTLPEIDLSRRAMILFTSGTTSLPKGVVTTHANIEAQIKTLIEAWQWQSDDHILNILPLHHVHGIINVTCCALWAGARVEFLPKFDAKTVISLFLKGRINLFMAVPTIYFKLIAYCESLNDEELARLYRVLNKFRLMVSGSAALPVSVLQKWRLLSGQILLERYGMTEIGMAISNPYQGERRPGYVGLPLPGVSVRLVDETGEIATDGDPGEIQIQGDSVFLEYWDNPQATEAAFTEDGWFKTGDMAAFSDGYYKILGRNSVDIIKSGGYKISALEIEEVIRSHPEINDCGVVGIPDEEWGEIVAACLVTSQKNIDYTELSNWLKERLPGYKIPRRFIIQDALPRNTLGKVTKNELKKAF